MGDFQNQVILITGAGRSRGRSIAKVFASRGAIIAANDLTPINLDETVHQITLAGGSSKEYIFDVAKKMPVQALLEQVREDWGRLDICIHCAQVKPQAALLDMDEWDWQRTLDVNLSSAFFLLQSAGRIMHQQGGGRIVCLINVPDEIFNHAGYSALQASKTGLIGLVLSAAQELGEYGVWVCGVVAGAPGAAILRALPDRVITSTLEGTLKPDLAQAVDPSARLLQKRYTGSFLSWKAERPAGLPGFHV